MQSGMMADLNFGDGESFHFHQCGEKPVHPVKCNERVEAFAVKRFEGASGIGDGFLAQFIAHRVGDFGGNFLDPGVIAFM